MMKCHSNTRLHRWNFRSGLSLLAAISIFVSAHGIQANVYPTNVRVNGLVTDVGFAPGDGVTISYLLNEPASAGVTIRIKSGGTTLRTISLPGGGSGTARGTNALVWNGKDDATNNITTGNLTVEVTAASAGYGAWTQISNDTDEGNYVYTPTGIAVNCNSNSPYYGRVFVANSIENPNGIFVPGDQVGLVKANADGSFAVEGPHSTGGWNWAGDFFSPWKVEISADDFVYVNDWTTNGTLLRFDQTIATNSQTLILRDDNWPNGGTANLSGPAIVGTGTNAQVWMADITYPGSTGVRRFATAGNGSVATNDSGTTIIQAGGGSDLDLYPYDVAVDRSNRIYTIQFRSTAGDPSHRVFCFPAYGEGGGALTTADWKIGSGDDSMAQAYGVAASPNGNHVAVAFGGLGSGFARTGGAARVFNATNGAAVVTLTPATYHDHTDVAWDNAGNLYTCDNWDSVWRVYSPPGANSATTVALAHVQMLPPLIAPTLTNAVFSASEFQFTINGQSNVSYVILSSTNLVNWDAVATNTTSAATRSISLPATGTRVFYRARGFYP